MGGAVVVTAAVGDLLTPPRTIFIGMTVLGPLLASLAASWRQTAAVASFAVGVALLLGIANQQFFANDHLIRLALVGMAGAVCVYGAAQREQRAAAMERLEHVAEVAQEVMLRPPPSVLGHVALVGRYVSASDEALVGGDLYETAFTPYGVRVVVGDVRGKGLDGIRLAASVLATFRESVWDRDLVDLARTINKRVTAEASAEDFVTVVLAEFPADGGVALVNCGHHPPLRLHSEGAEELGPSDPTSPLGLDPQPHVEHYAFEVGDRLLLCTDGLLEGRGHDGAFFPVSEHLDALALRDLDQALDSLLEQFLDHTGGELNDDIAVILAERLP